MSRQKGSRKAPRVERQRYREQYARPARSARVRAEQTEPITRRRRWGAALWATLALVMTFGAVVTALVQEDEGNRDAASTAITVAAALVPLVFALLAMISRRRRPVTTLALASPLAIAGFLGLGYMLGDPSAALVFSFGIAGAFVLRAEPVHRVPMRVSFVSAGTLAILVLSYVAPAGAVLLAPFVPFTVLVIADIVAEGRAAA